MADPQSKDQAESFLTSLLGKNLRITTTDTRMFLGQFKCTDSVRLLSFFLSIIHSYYPTKSSPSIPNSQSQPPTPKLTPPSSPQDQNIILSQTFEYRLPPTPKSTSTPTNPTSSSSTSTSVPETITQDLTSRYLGLIVVPGEYITKIEVEEFESQLSTTQRETYGVGAGVGVGSKG
ncbi:hypothetical protein EG329_007273 [Mollisiaceae sp. DMI_Dod_QoI]|nr:hypothetical protein EG329_007273 [Helotiales sp. DMI_Dod_QoI]